MGKFEGGKTKLKALRIRSVLAKGEGIQTASIDILLDICGQRFGRRKSLLTSASFGSIITAGDADPPVKPES